jgi:DNA polymerase-1
MLSYPVRERTPTKRPKTDRANLGFIPHAGAAQLIEYSECKKIVEQAQTYIKATKDGKLYTNYDICGTVSGRLSGFSPSLLNLPFSEPEVMHAFPSLPGFIGIHADLAAIEPCVLAHYSEDPGLLKVYKEGRGDIYLDLALEIFPERLDLKEKYDPNKEATTEVKEEFKDLRKVCKIIHLAVSYTGTHITVAKNLSKAGFLTERGAAMQLVSRYWKKFSKVEAFNHRLLAVYRSRGYIRNLVGRVCQVPHIYEKDLMNRLVQSSAHDILRLWVTEILKEFKRCSVEWRHWLPDLHDSTTFMIREGQEETAKKCYLKALDTVKEQVGMSVPIKCELKFNRTLAGIKGNE